MTGELQAVDALILAGGLGTRLRSVVSDRPKVLAEVGGRPFLSYLLDDLKEAGVGRVILATGYLAHQVADAFGDHYGSMQLTYCPEASPLGTGGAIRNALPLLRHDPVLVLNGDSWHRADFPTLYALHHRHAAVATLVATYLNNTARYGRLELEGRQVRDIQEKSSHRGGGWVNAGIYLLRRKLVERIPEGREVSLEQEVLPEFIGRGLQALRSRGGFIDIGTPDDYGRAESIIPISAPTDENKERSI